jgi:hypothetical protein
LGAPLPTLPLQMLPLLPLLILTRMTMPPLLLWLQPMRLSPLQSLPRQTGVAKKERWNLVKASESRAHFVR